MAFTKVAPAGIGSTPGDGYRIGDSFLHSTGVEITNINATGILTAASLDISGDIDFDGHTELDNVSVAGVSTFASDIIVADSIKHQGDTDTKIAFDTNTINFHTNGNEVFRITQAGHLSLLIDGKNLYLPNTINHSGDGDTYFGFTSDDQFKVFTGGTARLNIQNTGVSVNGHAELDNVNISGVVTATTFKGALQGTSGTFSSDVDITGDLDVDGHTNLDNVSIAGVTTITGSGNALEIVGGLVRSRNTASARFVANNGSAEGYFGWSSGVLTVGQAAATLSLEATGSNHIQLKTNGSERLRITSDGKIGINTASPRAVLDIEGHAENATLFLHSNDANANLAFSDNTGGARILNYGGDLAFRTGANAHAFGTGDSEKLRIEYTGSVGIGTDDASWGLSGNGGLVVGSGAGAQAITIFCSGNADLSFGNAKSGTARYKGLIRYSHSDDTMRFRTATSERLRIESNGNVTIGTDNNPGNALRYLDVYNTNTGSSAGSILRLLTTKSDGSSIIGLDIVKYKAGGAYIINNENVGADTGFIAFNTGSSGVSPATHLRVAGNGEVVVSPRNGGASNNRTSIHFNNAAHTPFIAFKSNNVTEAAYIKAGESSGGCDLEFQTKNTSGTLLSRLTLKNNGEIVTHQLAGGQKGYPLVMGTGTVSSNTNMSGSFNLHDVRGVHTGGGPNYHIGGWVFLGNDQAAAPYPARRFKIFAPSAFSNGSIVYQIWHNGDANYMHGGLWEIRMNLWTDGDIESVTIRCINGSRDDIRVYAYNDSNGIMVQPNSIWGQMFIRRAGWDDGGRNPGSSYCAVANNGALAIYNSQGTDDGAMPTSGSPVEVYAFDGTSGSAGATHTGAYSIENSSYFDG